MGSSWITSGNVSGEKFTPEMIQERRMRPIFGLLDSGALKKALAEVEKLLRKTSKYTLAKACKALALIRMGKQEEARFILELVMKEKEQEALAVGDLSHILLLCYRELHEPQMMCTILEKLAAQKPTEEMLVQLFYAQVRVQDQKKMHQTALLLYKSFEKTQYFSWTIASLVIHHGNYFGPLDYTSFLSLELAERMTDRFLLQQKFKSPTDFDEHLPLMDLYMQFLTRQAKWSKILDILKMLNYPPTDLSSWSFNNNHEYYSMAMSRCGQTEELFNHLKMTFLEHPTEFGLLKQLVDNFGVPSANNINQDLATQLDQFLNELCVNSRSFTVAVGDLYFLNSSQKLTMSKFKERSVRDIEMVVEFGLEKSSFFPDAVNYILKMDRQTQLKMLDFMCLSAATTDLDSIGLQASTSFKVNKDLNYELARRDVMGKGFDLGERIKQANLCAGKYLRVNLHRQSLLRVDELVEVEAVVAPLANGQEPPVGGGDLMEVDYVDQYLMIASSILISEHCKLAASGGKLDGSSAENVAILEELLTAAICLMEYVISRNPMNPTMRFVLGNAYARMGAVQEMLKIMQQIDIKHVQWDTLGYIIFPLVLTGGAYPDNLIMLKQAELMYSNFHNDNLEYVVASFNNCTFNKVNEFIMFRDQLLHSTQCGLVLIEQRLCELMTNTSSSSSSDLLLKFVGEVDRDNILEQLLQMSCLDNRDMTVLENLFDDHVNWEKFREVTGAMDRHWFKMRVSLLSILVKIIKLGFKREISEKDGGEMVEELERDIKCFEEFCQTWKMLEARGEERKMVDTHFYGVYPPVYAKSFEMGCPVYILEMLRPVVKLLKEKILIGGEPGGQPVGTMKYVKELKELVDKQSGKLLKIVEGNLKGFEEDPKVIRMEGIVKEGHFCMEHFSVMRIFLGVAISVGKGVIEGKEKTKGKQKSKASLMGIVNEVGEKFGRLEMVWGEFLEFFRKLPLPVWGEGGSVLGEGFESEFICEIVPNMHGIMQGNCRRSHVKQVEGFVKVAGDLKEYMDSFKE